MKRPLLPALTCCLQRRKLSYIGKNNYLHRNSKAGMRVLSHARFVCFLLFRKQKNSGQEQSASMTHYHSHTLYMTQLCSEREV